MVARSKASVCHHSLAGIAGSSRLGVTMSVACACCVVRYCSVMATRGLDGTLEMWGSMVWVFAWRSHMTATNVCAKALQWPRQHLMLSGRRNCEWHFSLTSPTIKQIVASYPVSPFSFNFPPLFHPSCIKIRELDCSGIYDGPIPRPEESYRAYVCVCVCFTERYQVQQ